jgi:hypothetical protein
MLMFPIKSNNIGASSRLVVRASEEPAAGAPATAAAPAADAAAPKPKPPPIGPKRGAKVSFSTLGTSNVFVHGHLLRTYKYVRAYLEICYKIFLN